MKKKAKRVLIDTIGWIFVLVGIVGVFLPFLQGIFFIVIGLYFLSLHSSWFKEKFHHFRAKHPSLFGWFDAFDIRVRKFFSLEIIEEHDRA